MPRRRRRRRRRRAAHVQVHAAGAAAVESMGPALVALQSDPRRNLGDCPSLPFHFEICTIAVHSCSSLPLASSATRHSGWTRLPQSAHFTRQPQLPAMAAAQLTMRAAEKGAPGRPRSSSAVSTSRRQFTMAANAQCRTGAASAGPMHESAVGVHEVRGSGHGGPAARPVRGAQLAFARCILGLRCAADRARLTQCFCTCTDYIL